MATVRAKGNTRRHARPRWGLFGSLGPPSAPLPVSLAAPSGFYHVLCSAMGWEEVSVRGYAELDRVVREKRKAGCAIFVYFSGDKDPATGISWCPDCVKAEPIGRAELQNLPDGAVFIYCQVGDRAYWKDPDNEFRKNLKLTGVPTLLKYGTPQKLVEEECFNPELVRMLFQED
nr:thioredoxin domain-containing protein 17 [Pogona vitticeps]